MSTMRNRPLAALAATASLTLGLLVGIPAAQSSERSESSERSAPEPAVAKLFVQDAQSATAQRKRGKRWKITLTGVNANTLWFADRPGRDAGRQSTGSFVREWAGFGFTSDPPNAVIQHSDSDGVAVELKNPRYNRKAATLTYTAILDPGSGKRLARTMTDVSVFIDDAGTTLTPVSFDVSGMQPGQQLTIRMGDSSGEPDANVASFQVLGPDGFVPDALLESRTGAVPVTSFLIGETEISLSTAVSDLSGNIDFTITLFISTAPSTNVISLETEGSPGVQVTARLGNQMPQVVNNTPTLFTLNDE